MHMKINWSEGACDVFRFPQNIDPFLPHISVFHLSKVTDTEGKIDKPPRKCVGLDIRNIVSIFGCITRSIERWIDERRMYILLGWPSWYNWLSRLYHWNTDVSGLFITMGGMAIYPWLRTPFPQQKVVDYLTFLYNDGKNIYTEGKVMSSRELVETQARTSGMVNGHELLEVGSQHRASPEII